MGQLPFSGNYKDRIIVPRCWERCWWLGRGRGHRRHSKSHGSAAVQALRPREALLHPSTSLGNVGKDRRHAQPPLGVVRPSVPQ